MFGSCKTERTRCWVWEGLTVRPGRPSLWPWSDTEPGSSETDWTHRSSPAEAFYSGKTQTSNAQHGSLAYSKHYHHCSSSSSSSSSDLVISRSFVSSFVSLCVCWNKMRQTSKDYSVTGIFISIRERGHWPPSPPSSSCLGWDSSSSIIIIIIWTM